MTNLINADQLREITQAMKDTQINKMLLDIDILIKKTIINYPGTNSVRWHLNENTNKTYLLDILIKILKDTYNYNVSPSKDWIDISW